MITLHVYLFETRRSSVKNEKRIFMAIIFIITGFCLINTTGQVKAYDWEDDDDDDWDDEDEDVLDFTKIKKEFSSITVSKSKSFNHDYDSLKYGKTNVYDIKVKSKSNYLFSVDSFGDEFAVLLEDDDGKEIISSDDEFHNWSVKVKLKRGKYYLSILALEDDELDYTVEIKSTVAVKKINKTIDCCDVKTFYSGVGKGTWKTSNSKVVKILSKKKKNNKCRIWAKKPGKAKITYRNSTGSKITYNITVKKGKTDPIDSVEFDVNYVAGIEPSITIANSSDKVIKYVYLYVSFYNAVGDKVANQIGGNKNVTLSVTGPIKQWRAAECDWNAVFYNSTVKKMKIEKVTIVYMDGSRKNVTLNKKF